ncbi:MAG: hypothetical protein R3335_10990 [Anaerolineales bacterium]|nr:hypothetical protein [Anaerolineales bacterium]
MAEQKVFSDQSISIDPSLNIQELLNCYPELIPVFVRARTDCVGCSMAVFCSLADVIDYYGLDHDFFLADLEAALAALEDRMPEQAGGGYPTP